MKAIVRKISALVLSISLVMSFAGVANASEVGYSYSDSDLAGFILADAIETIVADYNGDIDYDKLIKAALHGMSNVLDENSAYLETADFEEFIADIKPTRLMFGIVFQKLSDGKIRIRQIYDGSSAIDVGLKIGDILVSANGTSVAGMTVMEAIEEINKIKGNVANVVFSRDDKEMKVALEKRELVNKTVFIYKIEDILDNKDLKETANMRLVQLSAVGENSDEEMKAAIEELKAQGVTKIILDLRGNAGGDFEVGINLCKMLVSKGAVLSKIEGDNRVRTYYSVQEKAPFDEIVVLVDGYTASAAEMIAACLKDKGSAIVGQQTYGKASIQTVYYTYEGSFKLTTGEYLSPLGAKVNKIGIAPTVKVDMPEFLNYTLETSSADIGQVKKLLAFCGYEVGSINETYDDAAKAAVIKAKTDRGLEATEKIDIYVKDAFNDMYIEVLEQKDFMLEVAYNHMFKK